MEEGKPTKSPIANHAQTEINCTPDFFAASMRPFDLRVYFASLAK